MNQMRKNNKDNDGVKEEIRELRKQISGLKNERETRNSSVNQDRSGKH